MINDLGRIAIPRPTHSDNATTFPLSEFIDYLQNPKSAAATTFQNGLAASWLRLLWAYRGFIEALGIWSGAGAQLARRRGAKVMRTE